MKKIFSFIVVVAAVAMVSCAGNANKNAEAAEAEATEEVVAEPAACEAACDSTACEAAPACETAAPAAAEAK